MFSGVVRVETVHNDFDLRRKRFSGEFLWHDSVEAAEFRKNHKESQHPVCWTQTGYASGYASEFFDTLIVYKETECCSQGHRACRVVGKPAEMWPAGDPEVQLFRDRIAGVGHLPDGQVTERPATRRPAGDAQQTELDRVLLAPVKPLLDRLAGTSVPVLIWGPAGTGRFRAARYLHGAAGRAGTDLRRVHGSEVTTDTLAELAGRTSRGGARKAVAGTLVIDDLDMVPSGLQRGLALALEEGLSAGGPRVIGLSERAPAELAEKTDPGLLFAFAVAMVQIPPLGAPGTDLAALTRALLPIVSDRLGQRRRTLSQEALDEITRATWPGQVPELRAVLGAALIDTGSDGTDLSPGAITRARAALKMRSDGSAQIGLSAWINEALDKGTLSIEALQDDICARAVDRAGGNLSAAARLVGLTRAQLAYRMQQAERSRPGKEE